MKVFSFFVILLLFSSAQTFAQFVVLPVRGNPPNAKSATNSRTKELTPLSLPFWDDFSFSNSSLHPHDTLWQFKESVWLNAGVGINPPSINIVSFDGLDSLGNPYSVNDALAKGFGDKLTSAPIRLDLVDPSLRATVYLSFYYQFQGLGEPPDTGDQLILSYKKDDGEWEMVDVIENDDGLLNPEIFYQLLVPVTGDTFFHDSFQFRFQFYGRLSGAYDNWNIDYVYLNSGRSSADGSYPDRALTSKLGPLFMDYQAIPLKHFFGDPANLLAHPTFEAYNLRVGNNQPLNYFSSAEVTNFIGGTSTSTSTTLDAEQSIGSLVGLERKTFNLSTLPDLSLFDTQSDSIKISIRLGLSTKDNVTPANDGDYIESVFSPIDFRYNDSTRAVYTLSDYYAYDDGSAEYAAGLNQPGAQIAYQYDMKTLAPDTLVAVDLYFPKFGDDVSQTIQFIIWKDLENGPGSIAYQETFIAPRSEYDRFVRHKLTRFVGVKDVFYMGWKQSSTKVLAVGLDKNSNSKDKMFFNLNGTWESNQNVNGNLMMRPVFGKGDGIITEVKRDSENLADIFPNPNAGIFYLNSNADQIQILNLYGQDVPFQQSGEQIEILNPQSGIYLVRFLREGKLRVKKVLVRN